MADVVGFCFCFFLNSFRFVSDKRRRCDDGGRVFFLPSFIGFVCLFSGG